MKEVKKWITVNGHHVPIYEEGTAPEPKEYEKKSKRKTGRPTNAEVEESMAKYGYATQYKERTITYKPEGVSSGMNLDMFAPKDENYKYIVHPDRSKPGYWGPSKYFKTEEEAMAYIDEELKKKKKG